MGGEEKAAVVRRTEVLEFGGVLGASLMLLGLPLTVYTLNIMCNKSTCSLWPLPDLPTQLSQVFDTQALLIFLAWFLFQVLLQLLPVGPVVEGMPLRTGKRLKYRCNAFLAFIVSLAAFGILVYIGVPVTVAYKKFLPLATSAILFSFGLSIYLYIRSLAAPNQDLAEGGNSGIFIYDFFMGRELNPRLGDLDLKVFCELRPGLIGWVILDLCFVVQAFEQYGYLPPALLLVTAFHFLYVADALWFEDAILTTMDVVHDGFGFMLAFGDLAWVPFLYCLQARFLLEHPQHWHPAGLAGLLLLNVVGYVIFRGSNSQKNNFRKNPYDPKLVHLETMSTQSGRKLLVSGWWGMCRHPNYLGDLTMALSWSLACGLQHILPYFYPIYFLGLLVHRNARDEVNCRKKYGTDWGKYCAMVPYRIFPYIY